MRRIIIAIAVCISVGLASVAGAWYWLASSYDEPGPLADKTTVIIPNGVGPTAIAQRLHRVGVIADTRVFRWGMRLLGEPKPLRAGEFAFAPSISAAQVVTRLQSAKTVIRKVTFAEGLSNVEIAEILIGTPGLVGLVGPLPDEGHLLPETYHFSYGDHRAGLVKRMQRAMTQLLDQAWANRAPGLPLKSIEEALVLASIVEKETAVAAERRQVAGVFINRLRRGMRLQSDPTVVFGLTMGQKPFGRAIMKLDLRSQTPYNTYVIKGLPPGPIANPGRAAIEAVLDPAISKNLYFVADGSGGHAFARNLKEHLRNVAKWRNIEKARKARLLKSAAE